MPGFQPLLLPTMWSVAEAKEEKRKKKRRNAGTDIIGLSERRLCCSSGGWDTRKEGKGGKKTDRKWNIK